jgi:hypothetical protein
MWIGGGSPAAGSAPRGFHVCVATSANKELDLLELPEGTFLRLGDSAVVKIAGLRALCIQIDRFRKIFAKR